MAGKSRLLVIFFLLYVSLAGAQKLSRTDYIRKYQLLAISEMGRSGIPASIKMAQACLESSDGNSEMTRASNNHFGIKCKTGWDGARSYHDDDQRNECFRKYKNAEDSYIDHTNFLLSNTRYSSLFQLSSTDYAGWARGLKKAGYAMDPSYDKKVIEIIEMNQLWRLDHKMTGEEVARLEQQRQVDTPINSSLLINPYSSRKISLHNGLKSAVVRKGDTFEVLAQEFGLKDWELRKFNDYPESYQPQPNEIIYLQNKKSKAYGMYEFHKVGEGESMHYISQLYGMRLRSLYRKNGLHYGEPVALGTVLQLKKKVK